ncbi:hypothetical protein SSS_04972 [Sarcoptes scabiei]|uniref:Uncharacterized protein n=1 Tax=Sarcoptes scabiei TaxID=52283 RepID=A0A834VAY9_SARSC|nr:hypothetical protein SSS_04972 [Sarcoptes scabiei]
MNENTETLCDHCHHHHYDDLLLLHQTKLDKNTCKFSECLLYIVEIVDSQTSTFLFRNHPLHHLNNLSHNYNNNNNSTITPNNNNNNSSSSGSSPQSNPANERICPHNENILKCDTCNRNLLTSNSSTVAAAAAAILAQNNHNHSSNLNLTNSQNNLNHSNHNNHHLYSHHHHNSTDYSHSDNSL